MTHTQPDIPIQMAFSPCPNDTFIFHAMLHNKIKTTPFQFTYVTQDIEQLNQNAFLNTYPVTKLSFFAYLKLKNQYEILDSGAALGFGCGPLLICRNPDLDLRTARIAIPGELTTAHLLLKLWQPDLTNCIITRFDQIIPGIESNQFDAGLIIHESRFVYQTSGLTKIVDLGEWWEEKTGLPIPLGCIAIRKDPDVSPYKQAIESMIHDSIAYAFSNRDDSRSFIKAHAQEMDDDVTASHINLYVNDFSLSLGKDGLKAVTVLEEMAACRNLM